MNTQKTLGKLGEDCAGNVTLHPMVAPQCCNEFSLTTALERCNKD